MTALRTLWLVILIALPLLATWLWWDDGMWSNGAMPTHGFIQTIAGCVLALGLYGLVWNGDRRK